MLRKLRLPSIVLCLLACQGGDADESGTCDPGSLNCECAQGQLCLGELECVAGMCVAPGGTGDGDGDGDPGDGDGTPGDGDGTPGDGDGAPGDGDGAPGDGDGTPGDGDGDPGCLPGLTDCQGSCVDLMSDNDNCGGCDIGCKVVDDIGQCVEGQCENVWSECRDANADFAPCSEVCQNEGLTCSAQGCNGNTYLWYQLLADCEAVGGQVGNSTASCDNPMVANAPYYRCCCAQ